MTPRPRFPRRPTPQAATRDRGGAFTGAASGLTVVAALAIALLAATELPDPAAGAQSAAAPAPELVLVYTGSVEGRLEPCG